VNARGQYGTPLYGGSLYSSSPWGGAPDDSSSGWPYHGSRAFHGHEAPTYGRGGSWPPRREAPLGRGGLVVGDATSEASFAAMRRAVRAVFNTYSNVRAPFYVYAEVNGVVDVAPSQSSAEAYARSDAFDRTPGEVYTAVFSVADMAWPNPAQQTYHAALPDRAASGRGQYGSTVGAAIWQTPGAVVAELSRINDDVLLFSSEISGYVQAKDPAEVAPQISEDSGWLSYFATGPIAATRDAIAKKLNAATLAAAKTAIQPKTTDPNRAAVASFYLLTWIPFLANWTKFYDGNKGWADNVWWNHAPEAEQFADQLLQIRAGARKLGMPISSPEPSKWGKSVFDPSRDPTKTAGDVWQIVKIGIYGALGIGAVIALSSVAHNLRSGTDPADKYYALAARR